MDLTAMYTYKNLVDEAWKSWLEGKDVTFGDYVIRSAGIIKDERESHRLFVASCCKAWSEGLMKDPDFDPEMPWEQLAEEVLEDANLTVPPPHSASDTSAGWWMPWDILDTGEPIARTQVEVSRCLRVFWEANYADSGVAVPDLKKITDICILAAPQWLRQGATWDKLLYLTRSSHIVRALGRHVSQIRRDNDERAVAREVLTKGNAGRKGLLHLSQLKEREQRGELDPIPFVHWREVEEATEGRNFVLAALTLREILHLDEDNDLLKKDTDSQLEKELNQTPIDNSLGNYATDHIKEALRAIKNGNRKNARYHLEMAIAELDREEETEDDSNE